MRFILGIGWDEGLRLYDNSDDFWKICEIV